MTATLTETEMQVRGIFADADAITPLRAVKFSDVPLC
jgi:hypothetical protein